MNKRQLFKQLKNGKEGWLYYKQSDEIFYKIKLRFEKPYFISYSYYYTGNDEWDPDENLELQDVHQERFGAYTDLVKYLETKFPGLLKFQ